LHMEPTWTKVDLRNLSSAKGALADRWRGVHEGLARDLSLNLSAFLRTSVGAGFADCGEVQFSDLLKDAAPSSFCVALAKPKQCKLLLQVEYAALFPIIGIALGAKPGSFASPERKPTDIELQVVNLVFRLILTEAYRAWAVPLKTQLETVSIEIEPRPSRTFAATDPVFFARLALTVGDNTGHVSLIAPAGIFSAALAEDDAADNQKPEVAASPDKALDLLMPAKIAVEVWLDGSEMRLGDLLQLAEGQIVKLDHPVERRAVCTLNGNASFSGQIVSTGAHRAFMLDDQAR